MKNLIISSLESYPEFLCPRDLIKLGLYPSLSALDSSRVRGEGPSYIKFKRRVLYPKQSVIDYVLQYLIVKSDSND